MQAAEFAAHPLRTGGWQWCHPWACCSQSSRGWPRSRRRSPARRKETPPIRTTLATTLYIGARQTSNVPDLSRSLIALIKYKTPLQLGAASSVVLESSRQRQGRFIRTGIGRTGLESRMLHLLKSLAGVLWGGLREAGGAITSPWESGWRSFLVFLLQRFPELNNSHASLALRPRPRLQ